MLFKDKNIWVKLKTDAFQRLFVVLMTLAVVFIIILSTLNSEKSGEARKSIKYSLENITTLNFETPLNAKSTNPTADAYVRAYDKMDYFFTSLFKARDVYTKNSTQKEFALREFQVNNKELGIDLSNESATYIISYLNTQDIYAFKNIVRGIMGKVISEGDNSQSSADLVKFGENQYKGEFIPDEIKSIGMTVIRAITKDIPLENTFATGMYSKKLKAFGVLAIITLMLFFIISYAKNYNKDIFYNKQKILLLSIIFVITLVIARWIAEINSIGIPVFIATVLIAILLDANLAIIVNIVLTVVISLITPVDIRFILMGIISGSYSAIIAVKANKKNRLFLCGIMTGFMNALIVVSVDVIKHFAGGSIAWDSIIALLNGIGSIVIAIGILPFIETIFDIVSPVRLLQIMNPNHHLIKRLLIEAPGTYHHSLMVGNLAEAAADAIGANAILARAGAYYHDVGKLHRPDFFMENQMVENPHERLTPNLSTLVITAHTGDGYDLATKHKLPSAIKNIIREHHGTGLVAYFYHKAKNGDKGELVKEENFRYAGPRPSSIESAVVMLADCTEAAVRAMSDKTEGKIQGLIRKIIKDKLEDGQLAQCDLTLKDLDIIAKSFLKVFSGYFHEREEYPNMKASQNKEAEQLKDAVSKEAEQIKEAVIAKDNGDKNPDKDPDNKGGNDLAHTG